MHTSVLPKDRHIPGLDGIRALAIGLVLFSHSIINGTSDRSFPLGTQAGYAGVTIFFVLSGYLITKLLLLEEATSGGISLRLFYARRALRLFPALWLYLLALWLLSRYNYLHRVPWQSFAASLFYIRNLVGHGHETTHLWSLSLEEQFYIFWPLTILLCRSNSARITIAAILFCLICSWRFLAAFHNYASFGALHVRTDFRFDIPLAGCLLAIIEFKYSEKPLEVRLKPRSSLICLVASICILVVQILLGGESCFWLAFGPTITAIAGILLILSQTGQQDQITQGLRTKPLVALGKISYGTGVTHRES